MCVCVEEMCEYVYTCLHVHVFVCVHVYAHVCLCIWSLEISVECLPQSLPTLFHTSQDLPLNLKLGSSARLAIQQAAELRLFLPLCL